MKLRWTTLVTGLALCVTLVASGDQLYIRNRPFKGYATGVGKNLASIQVNVADLAQSLGYKLSAVQGNWVLHKADEAATLPEGTEASGKLFIGGKEVAFTESEGMKLVSLQEAGQLLGARVRHNPTLKTVDFDLVGNPVAAVSPAPARPRPPLQSAPALSSKYQLIAFGAPW